MAVPIPILTKFPRPPFTKATPGIGVNRAQMLSRYLQLLYAFNEGRGKYVQELASSSGKFSLQWDSSVINGTGVGEPVWGTEAKVDALRVQATNTKLLHNAYFSENAAGYRGLPYIDFRKGLTAHIWAQYPVPEEVNATQGRNFDPAFDEHLDPAGLTVSLPPSGYNMTMAWWCRFPLGIPQTDYAVLTHSAGPDVLDIRISTNAGTTDALFSNFRGAFGDYRGFSDNLSTLGLGSFGGQSWFMATVVRGGVGVDFYAGTTASNIQQLPTLGLSGANFQTQSGSVRIGGRFGHVYPLAGIFSQFGLWMGSALTLDQLKEFAGSCGKVTALGSASTFYYPILGIAPEPDFSSLDHDAAVTGTTVVPTLCGQPFDAPNHCLFALGDTNALLFQANLVTVGGIYGVEINLSSNGTTFNSQFRTLPYTVPRAISNQYVFTVQAKGEVAIYDASGLLQTFNNVNEIVNYAETSQANLKIGRDIGMGKSNFQGALYSAAIWNRALGVDAVKALIRNPLQMLAPNSLGGAYGIITGPPDPTPPPSGYPPPNPATTPPEDPGDDETIITSCIDTV